MSRYRPPAEPKSPYITRQGYQRLGAELQALWQRRHTVTEALSAAAAEGDRSENAEYIYRKKELREIDYRIRYLQKRLPILNVVDHSPDDKQRVYFGAQVTLENDDSECVTYRIVGPDEFDPKINAISMDSPLARALLKKCLDDEVSVVTPGGAQHFIISEIVYPDQN